MTGFVQIDKTGTIKEVSKKILPEKHCINIPVSKNRMALKSERRGMSPLKGTAILLNYGVVTLVKQVPKINMIFHHHVILRYILGHVP